MPRAIRFAAAPVSTLGLVAFTPAARFQRNPPTPPPDAGDPLLGWDVTPERRAGLPRNFSTTDQPTAPFVTLLHARASASTLRARSARS